jgi:hypothetical protein
MLTPKPMIRSSRPARLSPSSSLGAGDQQVVGPFQLEVGCGGRAHELRGRVMERQPRNEAELRRERRLARISQQQAGVEVAGRRTPDPAVTATPRGLLARDDPELAGVAIMERASRLLHGRTDRVADDQPVAGGAG